MSHGLDLWSWSTPKTPKSSSTETSTYTSCLTSAMSSSPKGLTWPWTILLIITPIPNSVVRHRNHPWRRWSICRSRTLLLRCVLYIFKYEGWSLPYRLLIPWRWVSCVYHDHTEFLLFFLLVQALPTLSLSLTSCTRRALKVASPSAEFHHC